MLRNYRASLMLTVLSVPLGACSSLFGIHMADRASRPMPTSQVSSVALATPTVTKTMLGRQQLADGQVGAAIETFQAALASGEDRAPAVNGLGVAYARLGRSDLALRYFQEATTIAPADQRYANNLALLLNSQTSGSTPAMASSLYLQRAAAEPAPVRGLLQRVSANEFHIATAILQPAPLGSPTVKVATKDQPIVSSPLARAAKTTPSPVARASAAAQRPTIVRVANSDFKLQRVSPVEVHIATYEPKPTSTERTAANLNGRFRPLVRIALANVPNRRSAAFVRIVLPEVQPVNLH